jgi:hypothetical protein
MLKSYPAVLLHSHLFLTGTILFLAMGEWKGVLVFHFVFLKELYIYTTNFNTFKNFLHAYFNYYKMHRI